MESGGTQSMDYFISLKLFSERDCSVNDIMPQLLKNTIDYEAHNVKRCISCSPCSVDIKSLGYLFITITTSSTST